MRRAIPGVHDLRDLGRGECGGLETIVPSSPLTPLKSSVRQWLEDRACRAPSEWCLRYYLSMGATHRADMTAR